MAGDKDRGLDAALGLSESARGLSEKIDAEREGAPIQNELFAGQSVFGALRLTDGRTVSTGPGRPKGARNKTTRDLAKLIQATGRDPLLAMAEIVATPIDVIARTLGCKKIEAAEYHRKVMSDLAPYVHQKLPTAVQVQGATAGMLVIQMGNTGPGGGGEGLPMRLIEGEQIQSLSDDDEATPHDAAPHKEGK
ncbi:hypothetical protein NA8A_04788 [Nitratireductor indicus C115]|uniref:Uncharacterized protein n=1 Tax=Nitratireductor indicus C115 TaxID=1231190 RepID=K2NZG5_9HYPH|nr:hypothetical protein [Nitratireductor indicus]EKF43319.1 hypothetical protein NA8A_04788 [Nitratireductor indicus C115]SFQ10131.1 hypothetical protein SAMN05216176_101347 [Nitratireductor indicus]